MIEEVSQTEFQLLSEISKLEQSSASQLAKKMSVSIPYVLSQLKLLEAKGVLEKKKLKETGLAGKPQTIYNIKVQETEIKTISRFRTEQKTIKNDR